MGTDDVLEAAFVFVLSGARLGHGEEAKAAEHLIDQLGGLACPGGAHVCLVRGDFGQDGLRGGDEEVLVGLDNAESALRFGMEWGAAKPSPTRSASGKVVSGVFCQANITWNNGLWLRLRSGCKASTSCSKGRS